MRSNLSRYTSTRTCFFVAWAIVALAVVRGAATFQPSLTVTVWAPAKGPVPSLTAKDFTAADGNGTLTVSAAEHAVSPLTIELIVENTLEPMESAAPIHQLRTSLQAFVNTLRAGVPGAKIGVFTDAGAATPTVDLNASPADLDNFITHFAPVHQSSGALLEALLDAAHALAEVPPSQSRRAIVTIDFAAPDPTTTSEVQNIERAVFQSGATLWSVSVAGNRSDTPQREVMLHGLAKETGGHRQSIVGASGLENQLRVVANSLLSQYTIQIAGGPVDLKSLKVETPKGKALVSTFVR